LESGELGFRKPKYMTFPQRTVTFEDSPGLEKADFGSWAMKKGTLALIMFLGFFCFGQEWLVFKDGRTLQIPGPYTVQGKFLQYHGEDGELLQLPLQVIDLEKSKEVTQANLAALEAEKNKVKPVEEKPKKSLTDIADFVERERPDGETAPSDVSITDKAVDSFRDRNPVTDQAETRRISPELSVREINRERKAFKEGYEAVQKEIDDLDEQIKATENTIIAMQNQMIGGDDPTSATYDSMEKGEKQLEKLKAEREKKVEEQKRIEKESRQMGIKNIKRPNKQRKMPKKKARTELEQYEEEDGSFDYVDEDGSD